MIDIFTVKTHKCKYSPLESYDQAIIDQLHIIKLYDNSVFAASIVADSAILTRILPAGVSYTYTMRTSDLKACLLNTTHNGKDTLHSIYTDDKIMFLKMTEGIEIKYNDLCVTIVPIDYLEQLVSQYKDPISEATENKGFRLVGTFEQGGYLCPKCNGINNAYTFDGICAYCGF